MNLITLFVMKEQEIFDYIVDHLRAQGKKSEESFSFKDNSTRSYCRYFSPDGTKCAIGCLLKEEEYHPEYDEAQFDVLVLADYCPQFNKQYNKYLDLLIDFQRCHDEFSIDEWESEFANIADVWDLVYTPLRI